ncbi:MAG TPA: cysteine synthase family protein [Spirochaetes bacterium]|nr:cysteine synthase family protein [Spirochaetota bacterium]
MELATSTWKPKHQQPDILNHIGNTPLIELRNITKHLSPDVRIFAKMEAFNPGGSVKDRPAFRMIQKGEESGHLTPDKTIMDATSGNTGIALAMIGASKGYQVELVMPENISQERKIILKAYGAKCIYSDPLDGSDGAIILAKEIRKQDPEKYFVPDQYNNPENWKAHYYGTAEEIIRDTEGKITHFLACVGTSGTLVGNSLRLKDFNPAIKTFGIQPSEPFHGLEGLKHIESSIVPGIYDMAFEKDTIFVGTDESYDMIRRIAREEGLFVGLSSGGAMVGALKYAETLTEGIVVTIFPDNGEKYFSSRLW